MDTRFWGPDGWQLFHSITAGYPDRPTSDDQAIYYRFFSSIPHILPCIYCRNSFAEYLKILPIEPYLNCRRDLCRWIYLMHNKVNQKLRGQGLWAEDDPPFDQVEQHYTKYVQQINLPQKCNYMNPGWDLMYCLIFNFPLKKDGIDLIRIENYIIFFDLLPYVMPYRFFRQFLLDYFGQYPVVDSIDDRQQIKRWLYQMEKRFCQKISIGCPRFRERCQSIELYRAGCKGKNDPKPTCHISIEKKN